MMNYSGLSGQETPYVHEAAMPDNSGHIMADSSGHIMPDSSGPMLEGYNEDGSVYSQGEFMEVKNLMVDGGDRFGVSAVTFDTQEELLWMANSGGHVTSYYGLEMQKYTSFQAHDTDEVRQMLTLDKNILALTKDSLRIISKFGRPQHKHVSESLFDMQCMLETSPTSVLLGGHQPLVVEYDLENNVEIRQVEVSDSGCAILRHSNHYICAGDTSGKVTLHNPKTLEKEHVLQAHSGTLSDFDVHGNQLVTCGFCNRMGNLSIDHYLMVYDLRMLKALTPLQMALEPMFLRFVPTYSDRICVVSQSGQFQVMEQGALTPESMIMYQVLTEGAAITAFDLGSSHQVIGFGDSGGYAHLFGSGENPLFNLYSQETDFPTMEHPSHSFSLTDVLAPLASIPMQYPSSSSLLSDWPEKFCKKEYRKPARIDPEVLRTMKMVQNVGYAPNPGNRRRNQIPYNLSSTSQSQHMSSVPDSPLERGEDPFILVPKSYRKVEIKYSKLGVEDFDFRHYNKTNFAGLETHIPNAYCNAMLQVLYFLEPMRISLLSHLCSREFCLSCELGFLCHMLDQQKGKTCQASNFLRAFRTIPEASALSLVLSDTEESMGKVNLPRLIQNWNRFILQQVHTELIDTELYQDCGPLSPIPLSPKSATSEKWNLSSGLDGEVPISPGSDQVVASHELLDTAEIDLREPVTVDGKKPGKHTSSSGKAKASIIKELFGSDIQNTFTCRCGQKIVRDMTASVIDLNYPDIKGRAKDVGGKEVRQEYTFGEVLEQSLCLDHATQAWCTSCEKYQPHLQTKIVQCLPDVLSLNCHLENTRDLEFWQVQNNILESRKKDSDDSTSATSTPSHSKVKYCRYGNKCTRQGCKFRHGTEDKDSDRDGAFEMPFLDDTTSEVSWIPVGLKIKRTNDGKVQVTNIDEESLVLAESDDAHTVYYEVVVTVAHIKDTRTGGNLVSNIKVSEPYHQRKERVGCTHWYLFNDFAITPIERQEALSYNLKWKIPCVLYFARKDILQKNSHYQVKYPISSDLLFMNASLVTPRRKHVTFLPLDDNERPQENDIVGLDAEFVTLNQEEAELRSDGTRSMIKPSQMSVARVTCVRGKGLLAGEPFIDDYISTQEQVVDYLTQFSGIQPGDLDAAISSKHLTTLKSTYLKLRYLVDAGVVFVGHGLKKDFRVINLVVPKNQVIDTVDLFHLPRQRMISLKFLAWHFLNVNIQNVTHDSTEDARTALKLYEKYLEMAKPGMDHVRQCIKDMYDRGRKLQWKIEEPDIPLEPPTDGSNMIGDGEELMEQPMVEHPV